MKKSIIFFIVVVLLPGLSKSFAQASFGELEKNKVIYPSPTAAGLGKYGEYPVSLYNGIVNIGQDIVTVRSGHLELNVSLSYHASGNKPSDIPGWVGLGMSLNAGGVITRVIKDLPDDATNGFYSANSTVQYLWNNYPNSEFVERYYNGTIDPRSDMYRYNFCGKTGEFFFDWNRNIYFKQKVPFKIQILNGPGGFAGFEITTDDGNVYRFDQTERTRWGVSDAPASSWYLTKISNLYGDNIILKYTDPMDKFRFKQYSTRKEVVGTLSGGDLVTGPTINVNGTQDEVVYLDEIDFSSGKLIFGKSKRLDPYFVPSGITSSKAEEQKLEFITLKDNNNSVIKQWKFEYFENSTERLKLKNLIEQGSDQTDVKKYSFSYNNVKLPLAPGNTSVNPYNSNAVDYWGYYNGWESNGDNRIPRIFMPEFDQYIGAANRSINFTFAQAEILEKITYPTGGYTSFQYEPNDYGGQGASFAATQNPMNYRPDLSESYEAHYDREEGGFDTDPNAISFTLTEPTVLHVKYYCGADGPLHSWATPGQIYEYDVTWPAGTHYFSAVFRTNELLQPGSADINRAHCYLTIKKWGPLTPIYAKIGPGLRIQSITTSDGMTATTRSFEYKLELVPLETTAYSSGWLTAFPAFYAPLQSLASNMQGYLATSEPINDIGEGAPVGYQRVVEHFEDNSFVEHIFRSLPDASDYPGYITNQYSNTLLAPMTSNEWNRGQETYTYYYNANKIKQKEISYNYMLQPGVASVQAIELKPTVGILSPGGEVNNINATLTCLYSKHSGFLYNYTRTETTYDKIGQNPIITYVKKQYDNPIHMQPTRIEIGGSDGSNITTSTSYPDDFAPGVPFIDYMQANHLTSFPIEQVVYKQKGGVNNIVSGNIITYKTAGAGLPDQLLKLETANPISLAGFKFSNRLMGVLPPASQPSQYSADTRYQSALTYSQYDNKGNLLESVDRKGIKTSYLWGYNQEFPVAQIVGADYATASGKITNPSMLNNPTSDIDLRTQLNGLRTIPAALTTTYTYAPLIGVTSETDPNGRTAYYEYDPFSRLSVVRDQDNNILKKYCYNYAGQPDQCNYYKSDPINGDYYSQNCPSGQTPVAYPVSVPGGMFTAVDPVTANQLAQQYAQDQANQHGTCQIVYQSDPINANYYSQNCASNQVPVAYPVSVPRGMFTSTDQLTANQLAQQYAQDQANQHGSCQVVYKSDVINAYYYSQNCPAGQGPVAYPVSVPQGMFTSTVDQLAANQLAQQYAQSQADQHGTCEVLPVTLYYNNEGGGPLTIQVQHANGQTYYFYAYGHDGGALGDIPPGSYTLTISGRSYIYAEICGYYQEGPSPLIFYGMSTYSCNYISIY